MHLLKLMSYSWFCVKRRLWNCLGIICGTEDLPLRWQHARQVSYPKCYLSNPWYKTFYSGGRPTLGGAQGYPGSVLLTGSGIKPAKTEPRSTTCKVSTLTTVLRFQPVVHILKKNGTRAIVWQIGNLPFLRPTWVWSLTSQRMHRQEWFLTAGVWFPYSKNVYILSQYIEPVFMLPYLS